MNDSLLKTVGSPSVLDLPKHIPQRSIDIEVISYQSIFAALVWLLVDVMQLVYIDRPELYLQQLYHCCKGIFISQSFSNLVLSYFLLSSSFRSILIYHQ